MNHQRLHCYSVLIDVAKRLPHLANILPRGEGYILDQLKRALSSAILNLAEGNSRSSARERARFFDISLASISESSSAIDIIHAYAYITEEAANDIKGQLRFAYAMIRNLKNSLNL